MIRTPSDVWIIAGPTASGKSALAVEIARQCDGVIINADSMQIYREIPVISAQPSEDDKGGMPHMLYGFQPITENCSAADWATHAVKAIDQVLQAGQKPILVGGSGLYLKALTEGFSPMPQVPPTIRRQISDLYDMLGPEGFHAALAKIDPDTALRLHPTDRQRCIRAREVYEASGATLSSWQRQPKESPADHLSFKTVILLPERAWLHGRINQRFIDMTENGAMQEAALVNTMDIPAEATGARAVGLQALRDHLDHQLTLAEAIELGQTQTRQYAKRQYTWFRNQSLPNTIYLEGTPETWLAAALSHLETTT